MSTQAVTRNNAAKPGGVATVDMNLEVVVLPVSNVDVAKEFSRGSDGA